MIISVVSYGRASRGTRRAALAAILVLSVLVFAPARGAVSALQQPAAPEAYAETIPGTTVKIEMVGIPGGTFTMGTPEGEKGRGADESPQHEVEIRPFWIAKTEITWDQYDPFAFGEDIEKPPTAQPPSTATTADAVTRPTPPYGDESFGYGKGSQPAINMTWHAAMEYTRWLSQRTGKAYRLATEAEWEYAARAGTTTAYSFGDDAAAIGDYGWTRENSGEHPHQVATKKPNPWGLFDMHGNVAEWCLDEYDPAAYAKLKDTRVEPVLVPGSARFPRVARGGSWDDDVVKARSGARTGSAPDWSRRDPQSPRSIWWHTDAQNVGFRIVRAVDEQEALKGIRSKVTRDSPDTPE